MRIKVESQKTSEPLTENEPHKLLIIKQML